MQHTTTMTVCEVAKNGKIILLMAGVNGNFSSSSAGILSINNVMVIITAPKISIQSPMTKMRMEIHEFAAIPMIQNMKPMG